MTKHYPDAVLHRPVRHGDLFAGSLVAEDVVVIVDGIYHHRLALRHKEILDALARGITVIGAASIGALRAAELGSFGMIGVGRVYDWYRTGVFDGDDAVSVAHGDTGSPVGVNVPLVNLYRAVLAACEAGVLRQDEGRRLTTRWEREYYPLRTLERALSLARDEGAARFADWYGRQLACDPHVFDQKQADTLEACARAELLAARPGTERPVTDGGRDWRTEYHRRWRNRFAAPADLHHRFAHQQIFDPRFPEVWWDFLRHTPGSGASGTSGLGPHVERHLGAAAARWAEEPELRVRITALLCPLPDLADPRVAGLLLRRESAQDRIRVADWLERTRRHLDTHPERSLGQIEEAVCARLLARIWDVPTGQELRAECGRRGFPSLRRAADAFRPFAIGWLSDTRQAARSGGLSHV
ncbi:TfuA-like protein [Streptomyces hygroscopicus]|uniref:TfuA-like protein n=1 Tax=Streptomyces hygroscopicus TaxID=1912 RepID=UPI0033DAA8C3